MNPQEICQYCHELFIPYAFHIRRQRACPKPECQLQRRRDTNRTYYLAHRYDSDFRWEKNKRWRRENGRDFMSNYRGEHPEYVEKNRQQQCRRDQKKANLVKSDVWKSLWCGKIMRIHVLEESCKVRRIRLLPEGELA